MEMNIHRHGHATPDVTTRSYMLYDDCRITVYNFTDYQGSKLKINYFHHYSFPPPVVLYVIDSDVVLP